MAEAVILGALFAVGEDLIGFVCFLEFFLGLPIAGIAIWMKLDGQAPVGLFDLFFARSARRRRVSRNSRVCCCLPFPKANFNLVQRQTIGAQANSHRTAQRISSQVRLSPGEQSPATKKEPRFWPGLFRLTLSPLDSRRRPRLPFCLPGRRRHRRGPLAPAGRVGSRPALLRASLAIHGFGELVRS